MFDITHLHPMIVHFPIALLIIAFLADLAGIVFKRDFFSKVGFLLLALGTAGLIAAFFSGNYAAGGLTEAGTLKMAIERHEDAAELTLWLMIITFLVRLGLILARKYQGAVRVVPILLFLIAVLSMARTGYYGGELVFKHAAGVQLSIGNIGENLPVDEVEEND